VVVHYRRPVWGVFLGFVWATLIGVAADAHDIPNQRVDRSIQVTLEPGLLHIDYEVGLTELTLTQDLRSLMGGLPGGDRSAWLAQYGQVTAPLNAKGFLVAVDGQPVSLAGEKYDLVIEEHPRYTFHYHAKLGIHGRLSVRDRNYSSSEGTSRLAVRGLGGVKIDGDQLPAVVDQIAIRPVWQLSDEEERRSKQVEVSFETRPTADMTAAEDRRLSAHDTDDTHGTQGRAKFPASDQITRLSDLLDIAGRRSWVFLGLIALLLGSAHAIQPGHGKSLVTAIALGPHSRFHQTALLGLATTLAHMSSVLCLALILWITGATRVATIHQSLTRIAGFVIAAAGVWRIGRHLGGHGEHASEDIHVAEMSYVEILGLGLSGGIVPCWDAVGLLVLAATLGRLAEGVGLVLAFSAGMGLVLLAVGWLAWKFKSKMVVADGGAKWQRRLGLVCGLILASLGIYLFLQA
jgi:nickel/cobalt transporter (NicO) family protein